VTAVPRSTGASRRLLGRWRLQSPSGADVISLRQLGNRERLRVTAPSMFTTGNMACGFSAILLAFGDRFTWAAVLLAGSIVLDIADGAVARLVGATSPFGVQLDSLSDLVSFGLAPAVLVHTWALPQNPVLAWLSAFFWLACAAFRLARFNVTVDPLADKKYFIGLPSPGATLVVIATIFALRTAEHGPWVLVPVVVSVVPALLMVTTVRFRSFRGLLSPQTPEATATTVLVAVRQVGSAEGRPGHEHYSGHADQEAEDEHDHRAEEVGRHGDDPPVQRGPRRGGGSTVRRRRAVQAARVAPAAAHRFPRPSMLVCGQPMTLSPVGAGKAAKPVTSPGGYCPAGILRSPSLTATTPVRMSRPPTSWTGCGSSPSSSQANTTAESTSSSATNEASRDPSRRPAAMPKA
jgi:CDP-diacylglycerol--serine O-phosphatidyltransferase